MYNGCLVYCTYWVLSRALFKHEMCNCFISLLKGQRSDILLVTFIFRFLNAPFRLTHVPDYNSTCTILDQIRQHIKWGIMAKPFKSCLTACYIAITIQVSLRGTLWLMDIPVVDGSSWKYNFFYWVNSLCDKGLLCSLTFIYYKYNERHNCW